MNLRLQNVVMFGLLVLVCGAVHPWFRRWDGVLESLRPLLILFYLVAFWFVGVWRSYRNEGKGIKLHYLQYFLSFAGMVLVLMAGSFVWEYFHFERFEFVMVWIGMMALGAIYFLGFSKYRRRMTGWVMVAVGWAWLMDCLLYCQSPMLKHQYTILGIFLVPLQLVMLYEWVWDEVVGWGKRKGVGVGHGS